MHTPRSLLVVHANALHERLSAPSLRGGAQTTSTRLRRGGRRRAGRASAHPLPETLRRSLTWDQGPEMRDWKQVRVAASIDVFFCDPHAPWQRGSNENTNGLLRQYFPKGTAFDDISQAELDAVADELNDRPRKRLAFAKPTEQLAELLLR